MRYPENIDIWREKYDGSTTKWLRESVGKNLKEWGFNSVGWEQEVTMRQWRHSRSFTYEEYQALNMPTAIYFRSQNRISGNNIPGISTSTVRNGKSGVIMLPDRIALRRVKIQI